MIGRPTNNQRPASINSPPRRESIGPLPGIAPAVQSEVRIGVYTGPRCEQNRMAAHSCRRCAVGRGVQLRLGHRLVHVHAARMAARIGLYRPGPAMDAPFLGRLDTHDHSVWCRDHGVPGKPPEAYGHPESCLGSEPRPVGTIDDRHGCMGLAGLASRTHHRIGLICQPRCRGRRIVRRKLDPARESLGVEHPLRGPTPYAHYCVPCCYQMLHRHRTLFPVLACDGRNRWPSGQCAAIVAFGCGFNRSTQHMGMSALGR